MHMAGIRRYGPCRGLCWIPLWPRARAPQPFQERGADEDLAAGRRWTDQHAAAVLGALAAIGLSLAGAAPVFAADYAQLVGPARTIDGDTLEVRHQHGFSYTLYPIPHQILGEILERQIRGASNYTLLETRKYKSTLNPPVRHSGLGDC